MLINKKIFGLLVAILLFAIQGSGFAESDEIMALSNRKNYLNFTVGTFEWTSTGFEYTRDLLPHYSMSIGAITEIIYREGWGFPVSARYNLLTEHQRPFIAVGIIPTFGKQYNPQGNNSKYKFDIAPLLFTRVGYEYKASGGLIAGAGLTFNYYWDAKEDFRLGLIPGFNLGYSF